MDNTISHKLTNAAQSAIPLAEASLAKRFDVRFAKDIARGVRFCAYVWDWTNSDTAAFVEFCIKQYCPPGKARSRLLLRLDEIIHFMSGAFMREF